MTTTYIILAFVLWAAATLFTPAHQRIRVSGFTLVLVLVFSYLFFGLNNDGKIRIPGEGGAPEWKLAVEDFKKLVHPAPVTARGVKLPGVEELHAHSHKVLVPADLSEEQRKALEGEPEFESFVKGRTGLILRYVPAALQEGGTVKEGSFGIEFTDLPYYDVTEELKAVKVKLAAREGALQKIQEIAGGQQAEVQKLPEAP